MTLTVLNWIKSKEKYSGEMVHNSFSKRKFPQPWKVIASFSDSIALLNFFNNNNKTGALSLTYFEII